MNQVLVEGVFDIRSGTWNPVEALKIRIVFSKKQRICRFTVQTIVVQKWMMSLYTEVRGRLRSIRQILMPLL